ncbi:MAG: hypothetical protein ACOC4C_02535, partial [Fibrobacterota bacterium]
DNIDIDRDNIDIDRDNIAVDRDIIDIDRDNIDIDRDKIAIRSESTFSDQKKNETPNPNAVIPEPMNRMLRIFSFSTF